jgi:hypothetical protein
LKYKYKANNDLHLFLGLQGRVGGFGGDRAQLGTEERGDGDDGHPGSHQRQRSPSDPKKLNSPQFLFSFVRLRQLFNVAFV